MLVDTDKDYYCSKISFGHSSPLYSFMCAFAFLLMKQHTLEQPAKCNMIEKKLKMLKLMDL